MLNNPRQDLRFRTKWIQWVLDLLQMDLNSLSKTALKNLKREVIFFSKYIPANYDWDAFETIIPQEKHWVKDLEKDIEECDTDKVQQSLKIIFQWITGTLPKDQVMKYFVGGYFLLPQLQMGVSYFSRDYRFMISTCPWKTQPHMVAMHSFAYLLQGFKKESIKKCKGCGRFFVDLTERRKVFCNPSCASRSIARMKREELKKDPEKYQKYLEKQKKYMKKKYREMKKAQLWPNVRVGRKKEG